MKLWCFLSLFVVVGLVSGFVVGKGSRSATPEADIKRSRQAEPHPSPAPKAQTNIEQIAAIEDEQERLDQLLEMIGRMEPEDFPALFDNFAEHRQNKTAFHEDSNWCALAALDRWCSLDPRAPANYFRAMFTKDFKGGESQLELAIMSIMFASTHGQPFSKEDTTAVFADLPFSVDSDELVKYTTIGMAPNSLTEALRFFRENSTESTHDDFFDLARLGNESPAAVIAEIAQFESEKDRKRLVSDYLAEFGTNDPAGAFDIFDSLPTELKSDDLVARLLSRLADTDAALALAQIDRIESPESQRKTRLGLLKRWLDQNPEAAMDKITAEGEEPMRLEILRQPYPFGTEVTLRILGSLSPEGMAKTASNGGYGMVVNADPNILSAWLQTHAELTGKHPRFVGEMASGLAMSDPAAFGRWFEALPYEPGREVAAASFGVWTRSDPDAAIDYAIRPGSPPELLAVAADVWSFYEPARATAWLEENLEPKQLAAVAEADESNLLLRWTNADPQATAARLMERFPPDSQLESLPVVIGRWASIDPAAAAEFLGMLPDGELRDSGVTELAQNLYRDDAEAARAWIETIEQDELREELEEKIR